MQDGRFQALAVVVLQAQLVHRDHDRPGNRRQVLGAVVRLVAVSVDYLASIGHGAELPLVDQAGLPDVAAICQLRMRDKLEEVTWELAEQTYARWRGRYKNGTICIMHQTLDGILTEAARECLISSNPVKGQKAPRFGRSDSKALSDEQIDALAEALDPSDGRQLAALLCLTCGLRKGEVLALRWSDWDGESIHVERADAGDGTDKPPKTPAGVRSIPVPSWLAPVLDGMAGRADEPICADMYGRRLGGNSFGSWWYHFRRTVGVDCTLHELRHSYLTRLARAGVHPRVMMRLAGHDSMRVCLEIYTHVSDDMQRDAVRNAFG